MGIATKRDELRRACLAGNQEACELMRDKQVFAEGGYAKEKSKETSKEARKETIKEELKKYNRKGRMSSLLQTIVSDEVVRGDPKLGSLPDLDQRAYDEEAYYTEELDRSSYDEEAYYEEEDKKSLLRAQKAREDRRAEWDMDRADRQFAKLDSDWEDDNALRVLQKLRLKEIEAKRQEEFAPADFNAEEFSRRVQNRPTPDWLGDAQGPMTDAERESIFADTDDFGNPVSTDDFGQTSYDINSQRHGILDSVMMEDREPTVSTPLTDGKPKYPSHYTPWLIEQLEGERKRKEFFQGVKGKVEDFISNLIDKLTNKNKNMEENYKFAEGGLMEDSSRLWRMESQYPEFQKGISSRVTKEQVPTTPVEEQFMYSPTQQGYAEGGSVYDETGSMLAPEVPLDFQDGMPGDMPMDMPGGMPMDEGTGEVLTPEETEVFSQALSDYPELQPILTKLGSALVEESMGTSMEAPMEGAVEGPGTGTSDSIDAKLSDGEFVFTAKAVKQLGVDKLRKMMSKAEGDFDESSDKQTFAQMSDEGFAAGGLINRPVYS